MSDAAIVVHIGKFLKHLRVQQNLTQAKLAKMAGLNRFTVGQIENGASISLSSFIQLLRALDAIHVLSAFSIVKEISPLEYAKLKKKAIVRVRAKSETDGKESDLGW